MVTGANRGIGREVAHQLGLRGDVVVLGARSLPAGEQAAERMAPAVTAAGGHLLVRRLDVTDPQTVAAVGRELEDTHGRLDLLVNNAAIHYDTGQRATDADLAVVREALETNMFGAWQITLTLLPLLRASASARVVNVSSEAGSLTSMGGGIPAYHVSKVALNALTRMLAAELRSTGILVNAVCPGWVATDMGGPRGRPVAQGAASILWALDLPDTGPTGGFFRDGQPLPW